MGVEGFKINDAILSGISGGCAAGVSAWSSGVESAVADFLNVFKNYWSSNSAKQFGEEIASCLDSANAAIEAAIAELNAKMEYAVGVHNSAHSSNFAWSRVGLSLPLIAAMRAVPEKFDDGFTGMDHTQESAFTNAMDAVAQEYIKVIEECKKAIDDNEAFDASEQESLKAGFENVANIIKDGMKKLNESFTERMGSETNVVRSAVEGTKSAFAKMGSN